MCYFGSSCLCVCAHTQPAPTAVGEEETVSVSDVSSPSLLLFSSFLPDSFYLSFSCSFSFIATAIRICPPSLAIILLGYAMHYPPTVTNWTWRPLTLLSLAVGAHPYFHSDCLAVWLPLLLYRHLLYGILQLFLFFWNTTCQTRLIKEPSCSYLAQRRLGVTEISWYQRYWLLCSPEAPEASIGGRYKTRGCVDLLISQGGGGVVWGGV